MLNPWWTPYVAVAGCVLASITFLWNVGRELYDRRRSVRVEWEARKSSGGVVEVSVKLTNLSPKADVEIDEVWIQVKGRRLARIGWRDQLPKRIPPSGIVRITNDEDALVPAGEDLITCEPYREIERANWVSQATLACS